MRNDSWVSHNGVLDSVQPLKSHIQTMFCSCASSELKAIFQGYTLADSDVPLLKLSSVKHLRTSVNVMHKTRYVHTKELKVIRIMFKLGPSEASVILILRFLFFMKGNTYLTPTCTRSCGVYICIYIL